MDNNNFGQELAKQTLDQIPQANSNAKRISGIAYGLILPIASITIGSLVAKKHKILASIGIGYGINMALSFLTGILTVTTTFSDIIFANGDPVSLFNEIMLIPSLIQLVIAVAGYFVTHYLIEKHLNLP